MFFIRLGLGLAALVMSTSITGAQDPTPTPSKPQAGDVRVDDFGISQVYVPAGCFLMGTSDEQAEYAEGLEAPDWPRSRIATEQAQHEVCISRGYWIDQYEVTNAAFQAFVDAGGYTTPDYWSEDGLKWLENQRVQFLPSRCDSNDAPDAPRACVTWYEAEAYAKWRGGALPTEAQWEYAARGPESAIYPWGNTWDAEKANIIDSTDTAPVGSFPGDISWVGAMDMAGNVMEWVSDWVRPSYDPDPVTDPTGPETGTHKAEKGGWWGSNALVARSAYQHFEDRPTYKDHHIGFRIVTPTSAE